MPRDKEFEKILQAAEDPKNIGQGSWPCPENPTPSEKAKYELCEEILGYQEDNNLSDEEISQKINLTLSETHDILFCRIAKVNWDNLLNAVSKLFSPAEIKVIVEQKKLLPMSEWFKLIKEEFSPVYQEQQWTYSHLPPFNFKKRTITNHP